MALPRRAAVRCTFSAASRSISSAGECCSFDDVVDSGRSIAFAADLLRRRGVGKLWTCALIDKPGRRKVGVKVDFVGFPVGDVFIAGYGTDYAEKYRHLSYIGIVE